MPDYLYTTFSGIGFLVSIPVSIVHWKLKSPIWATRFLVCWTVINAFLFFLDSIIWTNDDMSTWWDGNVYCDIIQRIKLMSSIGIPGSSVGMCRFFGDVVDPRPSKRDLQQGLFVRNLIDSFFGFILPLLAAALISIVESSRYYIIGVLGCAGFMDASWPSFFIYIMWPPILSLVSASYTCIHLLLQLNYICSTLPMALVCPPQTTQNDEVS